MKPGLTRRLMIVGTTATVAGWACGGEGDGSGGAASTSGTQSTGSSSQSGTNSSVSSGTGGEPGACAVALMVKGSNYGTDPHDILVPFDDIVAGATKKYKSTGVTHTHEITLTAADFTALRAGETVKKYSCFTNTQSTDHEWVFSCADPNVMPTFEGEIGTPGNCPA